MKKYNYLGKYTFNSTDVDEFINISYNIWFETNEII